MVLLQQVLVNNQRSSTMHMNLFIERGRERKCFFQMMAKLVNKRISITTDPNQYQVHDNSRLLHPPKFPNGTTLKVTL
jgi:hypothetical protein